MDYCKYHPLAGATHVCRHCAIHQCDKCIDDDKRRDMSRCFLCGAELESLGAVNTVEPFWRRLPEAFRYPLKGAALGLILGSALLSMLATLMPFLVIVAVLMYLFAAGAMLKYSFTCLERTALGEMQAPDVTEAYQGGIKLLFKLVFITTVLSAVVGAAGYYLGTGLGGFLLVIAVVSFPVILIRLAQTESVWEALNPLGAFSLILAIGLPYGVLMAFLLIMMSSVGVLHEFIGNLLPAAVSYLLQSIVSNYYTVVIFHLMGYMLFQYQGQLGYTARDQEQLLRSDTEHQLAKIDVFLKEGHYDKAVTFFYEAFKQFPQDATFFDKYFELLFVCKKEELMADYGTLYLSFLISKKRFDKITVVYKQILLIAPKFTITKPDICVEVARLLKQQGDAKIAAKLLNGMHKVFPDYAGLGRAYLLLAECFNDLPGMQSHSEKCLVWVEQFKRKAAAAQVQREAEAAKQAAAQSAADKPAGVKSRRPPPGFSSSGLTLELVPMDKTE